MKLSIELLDRFFYVETGRVEPLIFEDEPEEADEPEAETIVHVPMGFTTMAPEERLDDDETHETPEVIC